MRCPNDDAEKRRPNEMKFENFLETLGRELVV